MTPPTSERRPAARRRVLLAAWLVAGMAILGRSFELQVLEGAQWRAEASRQQRRTQQVAAPRGRILDRDGDELAVSHEVFRVSLAPHELKDPSQVVDVLTETLDLPAKIIQRAVDARRQWVVLAGRYGPGVREKLAEIQGVYVERELRRAYPQRRLARGLLGTVQEDHGMGGIEEVMDSILRGAKGREVVARDSEGRPIPGETWLVEPPVSGGDVVLTVDLDLQEIAHEALLRALEETGARGGDLLVSDPKTGEILAMVSLRNGGEAPALSAVNTPYEPGSIMKPFTVAGLLQRGLVSLGDSVYAEEGVWRVAGRTIRDVHAEGMITVADALRVSSNVGVAKAARAFEPAEQYENLRDFGFGSPTGIALPGEATGILRRPDHWSLQSPASLAIGYEIAVTPLQMAMAYGALANGGKLMEPLLVKEVRDPRGRVLDRRSPRVVRRVVSPEVSRAISRVLVDVVEDGTGTAARLSPFTVAGKSGTSRAYAGGGYEVGGYFSSFAAFFPAEDPQLVVLVKLERPRGRYYGGATAAPVTRATLEAVLAVRRPPLDRGALARRTPALTVPVAPSPVRFAALPSPGEVEGSGRSSATNPEETKSLEGVPVPDLEGLPLRTAVRRLHALGLRVEVTGSGPVVGSDPSVGGRLLMGDTVRLVTEGRPSGE